MRVKGFKIWLLKLIDTTPEKWTEAHLMEMSVSEPVPHDKKEGREAAVPENKLTLGNLAEGFWLFKTTFDFFYDTQPSMTQWYGHWNQRKCWKKNWFHTETIPEKWKSKLSRWKLLCTLSVSVSPAFPSTSSLLLLPPWRQQDQPLLALFLLSLLHMRTTRTKAFTMIQFPLMNRK